VAAVNADPEARIACISNFLRAFYEEQGVAPAGSACFPTACRRSSSPLRRRDGWRRPSVPRWPVAPRLSTSVPWAGRRVRTFSCRLRAPCRGTTSWSWAGTSRSPTSFVGPGRAAEPLRPPHVAHAEVPTLLAEATTSRCLLSLGQVDAVHVAAQDVRVPGRRPHRRGLRPAVLREVLEDGVNCVMHRPEDVAASGRRSRESTAWARERGRRCDAMGREWRGSSPGRAGRAVSSPGIRAAEPQEGV